MKAIVLLAPLGLLFWCLCAILLARVTELTLAQSIAVTVIAACALALATIRMIERSE